MALAFLLALSIVQGPATPAGDCTCRADLDTLAAKLERNYVAWPIEYKGTARESRFRSELQRLRAVADRTRNEDCIFVLRELTGWFHDGHLFVTAQNSHSLVVLRVTDERLRAAAGR